MKFFVDSADISAISELNDLGMADGVTTNPSLILKSGRAMSETIREICSIVLGPVSAEVVATEYEAMLKEGDTLAGIADNVCVKLPMTYAGLRACRTFRAKGIKVNMTLCFSVHQALLAAKAGASYISPFVGRLDDAGIDGMELIADVRTTYDQYDFSTEILVASIRSMEHIRQAMLIGAEVMTAPPTVLRNMIEHPLTDKGLKLFLDDWAKTGQKI